MLASKQQVQRFLVLSMEIELTFQDMYQTNQMETTKLNCDDNSKLTTLTLKLK